MAELNFGLLTPPGSQSIGNAFAQGMDQAAVARAQENQNALSQYTLGKAKREDEQQNQLYRDIQDPNFKLDVRTALRYGPQGMVAFKAQQDAAAAALEAQVKQSTLNANAAKLPGEQAKAFQEVLKPYSAAAYNSQTVDEAVANVRAMYANPPLAAVLTKIKPLEQAIADTTAAFNDPKTTDQWRQHWGGITPEKLFESAQKNQDPLAATIALRNKYPPGSPEYIALDAKITQYRDQNIILNTVTGGLINRQQQPPGAFVDSGIAQGVTPQMQMSNVDEARRQAIAMDAANLPVNIRVGGNALAAAPDVNALRAQPAGATTTPLNPKQIQTQYETSEKIRGSESEAIGKLRVDEYKQLGVDAISARKSTQGIDAAERILNSGFNTGFGTETQAAAANILASLGVPDAKNYATNAQLFLAQARTITNDRLLAQKGVQTDNDFKRTEETGARLGNTADANKFLLAVNRAINNQTIEKHSFFTKWENKNDSLKGAEQAWQDSPAGRASLFDRPELKQYAQVKPAATPTTTAKPAAPAVGEIRDGYRFKGGDPANIGRWEKVTP